MSPGAELGPLCSPLALALYVLASFSETSDFGYIGTDSVGAPGVENPWKNISGCLAPNGSPLLLPSTHSPLWLHQSTPPPSQHLPAVHQCAGGARRVGEKQALGMLRGGAERGVGGPWGKGWSCGGAWDWAGFEHLRGKLEVGTGVWVPCFLGAQLD